MLFHSFVFPSEGNVCIIGMKDKIKTSLITKMACVTVLSTIHIQLK